MVPFLRAVDRDRLAKELAKGRPLSITLEDQAITQSMEATIDLPDLAATWALAERLAGLWRVGDVIALRGDLGAGKTELARAAIRAAMGEAVEVPSPTFTLVQTYQIPTAPVWHFDLYRIGDPDEVIELGWTEARADGIALIEWADRLGAMRRTHGRRLDPARSRSPYWPGLDEKAADPPAAETLVDTIKEATDERDESRLRFQLRTGRFEGRWTRVGRFLGRMVWPVQDDCAGAGRPGR